MMKKCSGLSSAETARHIRYEESLSPVRQRILRQLTVSHATLKDYVPMAYAVQEITGVRISAT